MLDVVDFLRDCSHLKPTCLEACMIAYLEILCVNVRECLPGFQNVFMIIVIHPQDPEE